MNALAYLDNLLLARVRIAHCHYQRSLAAYDIPQAVVPMPRLILVTAGTARYTVEKQSFDLRSGTLLLVPARTRRHWHARKVALTWIEFDPELPDRLLGSYLLLKHCDLKLECESFRRIFQLYALKQSARGLLMEGELKAILARFLSCAHESSSGVHSSHGFGGRAIDHAISWLGANYQSADAMDGLAERVGLSPNHFRLLFKQKLGMNAQEYTLTLRMRTARSYLQETLLPVKAIAQAVGYANPLYFSRQYRRYWNATPSENRVFRS